MSVPRRRAAWIGWGSRDRGWIVRLIFVGFMCGEAVGLEIPFSVTETTGVARTGEPISGGLPLPKGTVSADDAFELARSDGTPLPCQVLPLVVDADGKLQWVLVDFQDAIGAGETKSYVLRTGRSALSPTVPLTVTKRNGAVVVDTGVITFAVSTAAPFGLFQWVKVGDATVVTGGRVSYVQMQGRSSWNDASPWRPQTLYAAPPGDVNVCYNGPLRVTIEVTGSFQNDPLKAQYKAWITAWAGKSRVQVTYKLCNSNPDRYTALLVNRSQLTIELSGAPRRVTVGAEKPIAITDADRPAYLVQGLLGQDYYQEITVAARAGAGERRLWTGQYAAGGWIAADTSATVFVCDKTFATNPARRLAVDGRRLLLDGITTRFEGVPDRKFKKDRTIGLPWKPAEGFWLFDASHHSSEYLFDFRAPRGGDALDRLATASRRPLWALAPGSYYSRCEAFGIGRFGTLADERACYDTWGWRYQENHLPAEPTPVPGHFVAREDNHYESEADSVEGLLLMYVRTGQRGWFDLAEAWARYHKDLQTWRTDGWRWKDGAIWFPSGGPQGTRMVRSDWNFAWGPSWGTRAESPDCQDLWIHARSKSCYCHFYGAGLADYYCLTGDRDALAAALDNVEQKDSEFRRHHAFQPGTSAVGSIRGFGRGFYVIARVNQIVPNDTFVTDLSHLCARTLWESPILDDRGFHPSRVGGGFGGMPAKNIGPRMKQWMADRGITVATEGDTVDTLTKGDKTWKVRCFGGTWQHVYIQNAADLYARTFHDENMMDFAVAFAELSARSMLSPKCHQTWYYTYFDVPDLGMVWDPWAFEHTDTTDGEGCVHSGWYTRFYLHACALGYAWTGEPRFLDRAKEFWYYGSKRQYRTKHLTGGPNEVAMFAQHRPPKDDQVLSVSRLFFDAAHRRTDGEPPEAIRDLRARLNDETATISFTSPHDRGGGAVVRYQVKCASVPIVAYGEFDYARDRGPRCVWWRAVNCTGEPRPQQAGMKESFLVAGVPAGAQFFAVRSFDGAGNRSALGTVAEAKE